MAKKKNKEPLRGIGRDPENKLIVRKSNPMTVLARSELSLAELKILDMYLARINTHNPEQRTVKLTKGQMEEALGITQIKKADLKQRLKNLYQPIDLAKDDKKRLHLISLFEEAEAEQDDYGVWQVTLTCTQSAMKYIFCVEDYGYFRYKLSSIVSLASRYSMLLFVYLEKNRFRKEWEVSLAELKHELSCDNDESYNEYKIFNQRILKKCQKELHEKTECRFTYEPLRRGRSVYAIRFSLETISSTKDIDQLDIEDYMASIGAGGEDLTPSNPYDELMDLLSSMCNGEFVREEIVVLYEAMMALPVHFQDSLAYADFLRARYNEMLAADARKRGKKIVHRFKYLLTLIRKAGD